jgi:hypothetical protein
MLFREAIAVYCENHTEQTDSVCTLQETHYFSATETSQLMLFRETVAWEPYGRHKSSYYLTGNTLHPRSRDQPVIVVLCETVAVCCENHKEHIYAVCTSQEAHYISATETSRLMLFRETVAWELYGTHKSSYYLTGNTSHPRYRDQPVNVVLLETVAVYCENHKEHINPVRTSQETHYVSAKDTNQLMLFRETVAVCCENYMKQTNILSVWDEISVFMLKQVVYIVTDGLRRANGTTEYSVNDEWGAGFDSISLLDVPTFGCLLFSHLPPPLWGAPWQSVTS